VTSSWFFLSTLNYDARSTTHQTQDSLNERLNGTERRSGRYEEEKNKWKLFRRLQTIVWNVI